MNHYSKKWGKISLLFTVVCMMLFAYGQANALTMSPVRLEISGNPGETLTNEITITNESESFNTYYSSFANFEASGETGNPSLIEAKNDLGTWMSTDDSISLKPKESKIVQFKIKIPNDAEPGGHFASVIFGTGSNKVGTVSIGSKLGVLVLLSVNGDVKEAGGLLDFTTKENKTFYNTLPVSFSYRFKNDGGDRIKPVGKITMHDLFYIPEDSMDANKGGGNILPKSTRRFDLEWVKNSRDKDYVAPSSVFPKFFDQALYEWHNYAFGPYFVKLSLLYGTNATRVSKYVFIFVFPWQLLICLAIIFFIVIWGGKKMLRRYNKHIIQKARLGMNTPNDATHV